MEFRKAFRWLLEPEIAYKLPPSEIKELAENYESIAQGLSKSEQLRILRLRDRHSWSSVAHEVARNGSENAKLQMLKIGGIKILMRLDMLDVDVARTMLVSSSGASLARLLFKLGVIAEDEELLTEKLLSVVKEEAPKLNNLRSILFFESLFIDTRKRYPYNLNHVYAVLAETLSIGDASTDVLARELSKVEDDAKKVVPIRGMLSALARGRRKYVELLIKNASRPLDALDMLPVIIALENENIIFHDQAIEVLASRDPAATISEIVSGRMKQLVGVKITSEEARKVIEEWAKKGGEIDVDKMTGDMILLKRA